MTDAATLPENPLLAPTGIPSFASFRPEHVVPGVEAMLEDLGTTLDRIEADAAPTWEGVVVPIERMGDRLSFVWGQIGHLMSVQNTPELRKAHEEVQPKVIELSMRLGQSRVLHDRLEELQQGDVWSDLDEGQQRAVECLLRDARLSGVALDGEAKERFNQLQMELAEISTRFNNNILDSTKAFQLDLTEKAEVDGLPASLLALAAQAAEDENASAEEGPWRITMEMPSFRPFMQHSRRRDLREKVFKAFFARASEGDFDNSEIIRELLRKKRETAKILGYQTWAEVSLASKMAPNVEAVDKLMEELRVVSRPAAIKDLEDLAAFARAAGAPEADELEQWDMLFWAERVREDRFDFTNEDLRPYFPLPKVLEGLFSLSNRLFGIQVRAAQGEVETWHSDVAYHVIQNEAGERIASFFLDPYSRPADKRPGAWMNDCLGRSKWAAAEGEAVRLPVAYLICNFTPPIEGEPALLTFEEVTTLFHEFGHGLQHMLTQIDEGLVSGIENVDWDAVELASQFMENWCYHEPTLMGMTAHKTTGEPLPKELFEKILAARTFREGSGMLRQLHFGMIDLELYHRYDPDGEETPEDVKRRIEERTFVSKPYEGDRFLCAFGHIFGGGYSAGYYSYKWAEVLSADAFAAFEEAGLDNEAEVAKIGRHYANTILGLGGSRPPMEVFKAFRGREPSTEALLRHSGLV